MVHCSPHRRSFSHSGGGPEEEALVGLHVGQGRAQKRGRVLSGTHVSPFHVGLRFPNPSVGRAPEPLVTTVSMEITPGSSLCILFNFYCCELSFNTLRGSAECMLAAQARLLWGFGIRRHCLILSPLPSLSSHEHTEMF